MFIDSREKHLELEIYSDEITETPPDPIGDKWIYIGALFVPVQNKSDLISRRLSENCTYQKIMIKWDLNHWLNSN